MLGGAVVGSEELIALLLRSIAHAPTMSAFNAWVMLKGLETLTCECVRTVTTRVP